MPSMVPRILTTIGGAQQPPVSSCGISPFLPARAWLATLRKKQHSAKNKREESMLRRTSLVAIVPLVSAVAIAVPVNAQKKYDPGASDTEIRIGNIMPYSGPASAYGTIGKAQAAYFNKINAEGGINGRKINFISYDDAFSPPKAVEQARKLVESDEVLLIF
jgi:ABC-type branched-subunit amino acid transport system substrate-binding protein